MQHRTSQNSLHSLVYIVVEFGNAFVCPVFSELRQNVTQCIRPVENTINTHIKLTLYYDLRLILPNCLLHQSDNNMFILGDGPIYV